jgi:hypothetical protein
MGWTLLRKYSYFVEVWETPTKFLACDHYHGIYFFKDSFEEANNTAIEYLDKVKQS